MNENQQAIDLVKQDGLLLAHMSNKLKKDKLVVATAIKQNEQALKYAHKSLRRSKKFISAILIQSYRAFEYADRSLKKDKEFIVSIVSINREVLKYVGSDLLKDKDFCIRLLKESPYSLKYVPISFHHIDEVNEIVDNYSTNPSDPVKSFTSPKEVLYPAEIKAYEVIKYTVMGGVILGVVLISLDYGISLL